MVVTVTSVATATRRDEAAAAVFIVVPALEVQNIEKAIYGIFWLTPSEARVAAALVTG